MKKHKHTYSSQPSEEHGLSADVVQSLRKMVDAERQSSMMSMPEERVMRAVRAASRRHVDGTEVIERELISWFRPVVVAGLVVIMALAFYNFDLARNNDHHQTATEMVLGLHPVTVASAYDLNFDSH